MMSTLSGLLVGLLLVAVLTVMYGPQLSSRLHEFVDARLIAPADAVESPVAEVPVAESRVAESHVAEDVAAEVPIADAPVAEEIEPSPVVGREQDELERRWAVYADNAADLEPQGTFPWQACFQRAAASHDLPQALLLAIASGESNFDPAARSDKDAIGLMQIRWPLTSFHLGVRRETDLYDPCTNVDAGARYFRELSNRYGRNLHLALAAYNYGPSRVAAGNVPEGAIWYSHYIYQHLQQVIGEPVAPTSELVSAPEAHGAGRDVLMTFNRAHRARDFIAFLNAQVPGIKLQQQSEGLGRHEVVLLYGSEAEKNDAIEAMSAAGLDVFSSRSQASYYL
jgi:hypothetical protein